MQRLWAGLVFLTMSLTGLGFAQSTPQQVAGPNWQALTADPPAVTIAPPKCIAWRGLDSKIYFATLSGTTWTNYQVVGGSGWTAESSAAPALSWNIWSGGVALAWKGLSSNHIWFSIWNGTSWSPQQVVSGSNWTAETGTAPTLSDSLTVGVAWKELSGNRIWYSVLGYSGEGWSTEQVVQGTHKNGTTWTADTGVAPGWQTTGSPATWCSAMFWEGLSGDVFASFSSSNSANCAPWSPQQTVSCTSPSWTAETSAPPASTFLENDDQTNATDAVFWKGLNGTGIWYSHDGGSGCNWAQQQTVSGSGWTAATDVAPAVGSVLDVPDISPILAWKNATDNTVWYLDPTTLPGLTQYAPSTP
jgi:hypothetical protein